MKPCLKLGSPAYGQRCNHRQMFSDRKNYKN